MVTNVNGKVTSICRYYPLDARYYVTFSLTIVSFSVTLLRISLTSGTYPDAIRITERVRCPRTVSQTAPGRFRASASQHYRLGREVLAGLGQVEGG